MTGLILTPPPARKWCAFGGAALVFFFLNAATFTSLGVVLFTMGADLHWSMTYAGLSFTALGLSCGLSSPLAAIAMTKLGGRGSLGLGATLLAIGFAIASMAQTLAVFFVAMLFLGIGFTLSGNIVGVYLIAGWFRRRTAAIIGYYLMLGALGAAFGPPLVESIVRNFGWRTHWQIMAIVAAAIAAICLLIVRDTDNPRDTPIDIAADDIPAETGWSYRHAILTPQFLLVCAAMIMTMCCGHHQFQRAGRASGAAGCDAPCGRLCAGRRRHDGNADERRCWATMRACPTHHTARRGPAVPGRWLHLARHGQHAIAAIWQRADLRDRLGPELRLLAYRAVAVFRRHHRSKDTVGHGVADHLCRHRAAGGRHDRRSHPAVFSPIYDIYAVLLVILAVPVGDDARAPLRTGANLWPQSERSGRPAGRHNGARAGRPADHRHHDRHDGRAAPYHRPLQPSPSPETPLPQSANPPI